MAAPRPGLSDIAQALGSVANVKFGPGPLGRVGTVLIIFNVVMAVVAGFLARSAEPGLALHPIYLMAGSIAIYLVGAFIYVHVQPVAAALDSSHFAKVLTHDAAMRAGPGGGSLPLVNITPPIENPRLADRVVSEGNDHA